MLPSVPLLLYSRASISTKHPSPPLLVVPLLPQVLRVPLPLGLEAIAQGCVHHRRGEVGLVARMRIRQRGGGWRRARGSDGEVGANGADLASLTIFFLPSLLSWIWRGPWLLVTLLPSPSLLLPRLKVLQPPCQPC
jgi:hypothetical protein